jgi:hypothetical protein
MIGGASWKAGDRTALADGNTDANAAGWHVGAEYAAGVSPSVTPSSMVPCEDCSSMMSQVALQCAACVRIYNLQKKF